MFYLDKCIDQAQPVHVTQSLSRGPHQPLFPPIVTLHRADQMPSSLLVAWVGAGLFPCSQKLGVECRKMAQPEPSFML